MSWETWASLDDVHPWETWVSLDDVHRSSAAKETVIFGPALVYVVNFDSSFPYPRRFLYSACSKTVGYKRVCGRSLEFDTACHWDGGFTDMYRFNLILVDAVHGCKPLRAQVWDPEAFAFLRLRASDLRKCTEAEQINYVQKLTLQTPKCSVYLHLQEGVASIQKLSILYPWPLVSYPPSLRIADSRGGPAELLSTLPRSSIPGSSTSYYTCTRSGSSTAYYIPSPSGCAFANYIPPSSGYSIAYTPTPSSSSAMFTPIPLVSSRGYAPPPSSSSTAYTSTPLESSVASAPGSSTSTPSRPDTPMADTLTRPKRVCKSLQQQLTELLDVLKDTNLDDELEIDESVDPAHEGVLPTRDVTFDVQEDKCKLMKSSTHTRNTTGILFKKSRVSV